jgi:hypothetical protein
VCFEEEDVSVLGGDLRLASFEAGRRWPCGGGAAGSTAAPDRYVSPFVSVSLALSPSLS